ncbi:MAG: hypothetical protein ACLPVF_13375 [Acidimicrobiales bacterium]
MSRPDVDEAQGEAGWPGEGGGPARPARHHRIRWALLGAVGLVVVLVVVSLLIAYHGRARPVSVGQATSQYHPGAAEDTGPHPAPGVYTYTGSGTDRLSLPPLSQPEGPTLPGTVELEAKGCWSFRIDLSTNHWQSWTYCRHPAGLAEAEEQVWQRWMVGPVAVTNLTTLHCDPGSIILPAARSVGQSWPVHCSGRSTEISGSVVGTGTYRFMGESTMTIGGRHVRAAHFLRHWSLRGAQVGPERDDLWLDAATGLPLENRRDIRVRTATPFGTSTYTETGTYVLRALTPVT